MCWRTYVAKSPSKQEQRSQEAHKAGFLGRHYRSNTVTARVFVKADNPYSHLRHGRETAFYSAALFFCPRGLVHSLPVWVS